MRIIKEIDNLAYDHPIGENKISVLRLLYCLDKSAIHVMSFSKDWCGSKSLADKIELSKKETEKLVGALQMLLDEWEETEKADTLEELKRERDNADGVYIEARNEFLAANHKYEAAKEQLKAKNV